MLLPIWCSVMGLLGGFVQVDPDHPQFFGAHRATNVAAELSAFAVAQAVAFQFQEVCPVIIRPDLKLSGQVAEGKAFVHGDDGLAAVVSSLQGMLGPQVTINEVRGHVGHEWNELADQLAKWVVREQQVCGVPPFHALNQLAADRADAKWAWLQHAPNSHHQALPSFLDQQVWSFDPVDRHQLWSNFAETKLDKFLTIEFSVMSLNVLWILHGRQLGSVLPALISSFTL